VNDVTKQVLADHMVGEICDPFEKWDRAVDLLTVLYYDGAIVDRESIMRGGQVDLREDGDQGQWRPVTPAEGDWLRAVLGGNPIRLDPGVWVSDDGDVIHLSADQGKVDKEAGQVLNAARYEIRSRSVYGCWTFAKRPLDASWFCLEFCLSIELWTDLEFAEPVPWLLVCYSPREPDVCSDVGHTDAEGSWLVTDRPDDQAEVPRPVDEEVLEAGDGELTNEQALATGVARPSKSRGFGRQRFIKTLGTTPRQK